MGGQNILFGFDDLSAKDKAVKSIQRQFARLGASVVSVDIPTTTKRKAGLTYREVNLTFADSQTVTLAVKKTGDIFEVRLNKKAIPIKNQDDQPKALAEIVDAMNAGRAAFQKKLAAVKIPLPSGVKTTTKKKTEAQAERIAQQKALVEEGKARLSAIRAEIEANRAEILKLSEPEAIA